MACTATCPGIAPIAFCRPASATRAGSRASLRAATLQLGATHFTGQKLVQSAQGRQLVQGRSASVPRAKAVSTSAPKTATAGDSPNDSWLELHGVNNWKGLLPVKGENDNAPLKKQIDPALKDTILKYGEMAQLTYDSVDLSTWSRYRLQNRYTREVGGQKVPGNLFGPHLESQFFYQHLKPNKEYEPIAYIYASENDPTIRKLTDQQPKGQEIEKDVWIGYIAYSESLKDIVVAWRGTSQPAEWIADGELSLMPYTEYDPAGHKNPPSKGNPLYKAACAALAFVGASFWGGLSGYTIGTVFCLAFKIFKSESLVGALYNAAFAALAALPIAKTFPRPLQRAGISMKDFVLGYAAGVGVLTVLLNLVTSSDQFWTVDGLIFAFAVIIPTGLTSAKAAWDAAGEGPQVHEGFYELYDPTGDTAKSLPKSGMSPRKVVHETVDALLERYPDVRTISVCGHSLGGALTVLCAYDLVESQCNLNNDKQRVPVAAFAFEAPRVGNPTFKKAFEANKANGLAAIRVVNKPDIVTQVPKAFFLQNVYYVLAAITNNDVVVDIINWVEELGYKLGLPSAFQHVAPEQELVHDSRQVDYLKKMPGFNPLNNIPLIGSYHNNELNLHMVSGFWSDSFTRDFALCNKTDTAIDERAGVAPGWGASLVPRVTRSKGGAIIEPYSKELPPLDGEDNERKVGHGPGVNKPMVRDYFKRYLGQKPAVANEKSGLLDVSPKLK